MSAVFKLSHAGADVNYNIVAGNFICSISRWNRLSYVEEKMKTIVTTITVLASFATVYVMIFRSAYILLASVA